MFDTKKNTSKNQSWTSQQLIELSQILGEAYLPGLNISKSSEQEDVWTISKFKAVSKNIGCTEASDT